MATYVVATKKEAQAISATAEEHVRGIPGVRITSRHNPNCIIVEASEAAATEIKRLFGSLLLVEPELRGDT